MTFAPYLKQLRNAQKIPVSRLAQQSGISRATLHRWESGDRLPCVPELEAVLMALDATPQQRQHALALLPVPRAQAKLTPLHSSSIPLPHGGDLLRALRLRQSWTRAQTASALQVTLRTLTRWETGEAWPDVETLQKVCTVLHAHPQEQAALASGRYVLDAWNVANASTSITREQVEARLHWLLTETETTELLPLQELFYLSLTAQTGAMARREERALPLMRQILSHYAQYCTDHDRDPEAARLAESALDLPAPVSGRLSEDYTRSVLLALRGQIFPAARRSDLRQGIERLTSWLAAPLLPKVRAWYLSEISFYWMHMGCYEESIEVSKQACTAAVLLDSPRCLALRQGELAVRYLMAGKPEQMLDIASRVEDRLLPRYDRIAQQLCRTKAYLALGEKSEAHSTLSKIQQELEIYPLLPLAEMAESLTAQM